MYTIPNFTGDDGDYDTPTSQCESDTCGQHYGEAQRVHLLSLATGEIVATRTLCQKAQRVANQNYGVVLAGEPCENCGGSDYVYTSSDAYDGAEPCRVCNADETYVTLLLAA